MTRAALALFLVVVAGGSGPAALAQAPADSDADGVPNDVDDCPLAYDPLQQDADGDGIGDACEVSGLMARVVGSGDIVASAQKTITTRAVQYSVFIAYGSICAKTMKLDCTIALDADEIALATRGTAVNEGYRGCGEPSGPEARTVITGGGKVKIRPETQDYGTIEEVDESGTNPRVAECNAALTAARTASAKLAALPPNLTLGDITVPLGGFYQIDVRGMPSPTVVNVRSLDILGLVKVFSGADPGYLTVLSDGQEVVINVLGLFRMETATSIADFNGIINVVGRGSTIAIGGGAFSNNAILAPGRAARLETSTTGDGTLLSRGLFVNRALFIGDPAVGF